MYEYNYPIAYSTCTLFLNNAYYGHLQGTPQHLILKVVNNYFLIYFYQDSDLMLSRELKCLTHFLLHLIPRELDGAIYTLLFYVFFQ